MSIRTLAQSSAVLALVVAYPSLAADAPSASAEPMVKSLAEQKFESFPDTPTCVKGAVLNGDPSKGASLITLKAASGCRVPWHWHSSAEEVLMATGVGTLGMKGAKPSTVRAGAYAMIPAHHVHEFTCKISCTLFLRVGGVFDLHYVNAAGTEIPSAEALKTEAPKKN
jgi:quercetin dioxygenase-like cupin family protein